MYATPASTAFESAALLALVKAAIRRFRRLTGLVAVVSIDPALDGAPSPGALVPIVHPRCARRLRTAVDLPPCGAEWQVHIRASRRTGRKREHLCPLGLRCASIPILLGDSMPGMVKCVAGPEVSEERFTAGVGVLEVLMVRACLELEAEALRRELSRLRTTRALMEKVSPQTPLLGFDPPTDPATETGPADPAAARPLVVRITRYLHQRYSDPGLTLGEVAAAMGRNEKYVAHLFATSSGIRMRGYITVLRLRRACELLLHSGATIEEIAAASGFAHVSRFRELFRRIVGVTPSRYRQVFASASSSVRTRGVRDRAVPSPPRGHGAPRSSGRKRHSVRS